MDVCLEPLYRGKDAIKIAETMFGRSEVIQWRAGSTAPRDGSMFRALVDDVGSIKLRWMGADEFADFYECMPEEALEGFVEPTDHWIIHRPRLWRPFRSFLF